MLARATGMRGIVIPDPCAAEAEVVDGITVHAVRHLGEIIGGLRGEQPLRIPSPGRPTAVDMAEVRCQNLARAAIEVAVAGGHNVLLAGPPGTGKSMISRRI
jgi:magnesium chelatase family protein